VDQKEFENWLKEQDRETCVKIAVRAALRVLPVVMLDREQAALVTVRTILVSGIISIKPHATIVDSAYDVGDAARVVGDTSQRPDALYAATHAAHTSHADADHRAPRAFSAIKSAFLADDGTLAGAFKDASIEPKLLFAAPLWHDQPEPKQDLPGENLLDTLAFAFWKEWYQGFLDGKPMDWDLQYQVALIPDVDWEKGPEHIARIIDEIRARLALQKRIAELEAALVAATTEQRLGIGGNNPPEPIEAPAPVAKELLVISEPLQELKAETEAEEPDKGKVARAIDALKRGLLAGLKWFASKADLAVDETIKETTKWGVRVGASYIILNSDKISAVFETAKAWLNTLP